MRYGLQQLEGQAVCGVHFTGRTPSTPRPSAALAAKKLPKIMRSVAAAKIHLDDCFGEWSKCEALCAVCHGLEETKTSRTLHNNRMKSAIRQSWKY